MDHFFRETIDNSGSDNPPGQKYNGDLGQLSQSSKSDDVNSPKVGGNMGQSLTSSKSKDNDSN